MRTGMARSCIGDVITDRINLVIIMCSINVIPYYRFLYLISYNFSTYFKFPIIYGNVRESIEKNL